MKFYKLLKKISIASLILSIMIIGYKALAIYTEVSERRVDVWISKVEFDKQLIKANGGDYLTIDKSSSILTLAPRDSVAISLLEEDFVMSPINDTLKIHLYYDDQILLDVKKESGYHILVAPGNGGNTTLSGFGQYSRFASEFTILDKDEVDIEDFIEDYVLTGAWVVDD